MTLGQKVAARYKGQYCKRGDWKEYEDWETQPRSMYLILIELKTKRAIDALLGNDSWTRFILRQEKRLAAKQAKEDNKP